MTRLEQLQAEQAKRGQTAASNATTAALATGNESDRQKALLREQERRANVAGAQGPEDTVIPGLHVARAAQALDDTMRIAATGMSGGWADKIAAGLNTAVGNVGSTIGLTEDPTYANELAKERAFTQAAKDRYNARTPGSGETMEALTSLVGPLKLAGSIPKEWNVVKQAVTASGIGAGWGGLSAAGHDRDPVTGALVGGAGGALPIVGATGGKMLPWASGAAAGAGAGWLTGKLTGSPWLGAGAGSVVGPTVKQGMEALLSKVPVAAWRDALARLTVTPGAVYGSRDNQEK